MTRGVAKTWEDAEPRYRFLYSVMGTWDKPVPEIIVARIDERFARLSDKERKVIVLRYGLENHKWHSRAEIGAVMRLSSERIRQIEAKVLRRLRWGLYAHE